MPVENAAERSIAFDVFSVFVRTGRALRSKLLLWFPNRCSGEPRYHLALEISVLRSSNSFSHFASSETTRRSESSFFRRYAPEALD